jgi:hypothetical protein
VIVTDRCQITNAICVAQPVRLFRVTDSPSRGERKQRARFSLSRVPDKSEAIDNLCTALRSLAGRLIDSQAGRKLFAGEPAQDNERQSEFQRRASQSKRDRALEFR